MSYVSSTSSEGRTTFGLDTVSPPRVAKALKLLGGEFVRQAKGHPHDMYRMPTGRIVRVINGRGQVNHDVGKSELKGILDDVRNAGIDPLLFVAVCERAGACRWYQKDGQVSRLARFLRSRSGGLRTEAQQKAALKAFAEEERRRMPANGDKPQEETSMPEATATPPQPETKANYSTADVLDLVGLEGRTRKRASVFIANHLSRSHGSFASLAKRGGVIRDTSGPRTVIRFTETGAMEAAEEVRKRYGEPTEAPAPEEPVGQQVTGSAEVTLSAPQVAATGSAAAPQQAAEPEPAPEPTPPVEAPQEPTAAPQATVTSTPRPDVPETPGAALMLLCRHYDVVPAWKVDRFELDIEETILSLGIALADAMRDE